MTPAVRNARPADLPRFVELLAEQLAGHSLEPPRETLAAAVEALAASPALGRLLVAEHGDTIVGIAAMSWAFSLEHGGRSAWLDELYVRPVDRGRGIGTALVRACFEEASAAGAVAMDLEVEAGHEDVERLYDREGFRPHARRRWWRRLRTPA
jgi:GNAT superfamily N-acetyltransferase